MLIDTDELLELTKKKFPCNDKDDKNIRRAVELLLSECITRETLPNNATNQDVLKTVFSDFTFMELGDTIIGERFEPYCKVQFNKNWWNAPYKADKESD